MRKHKSRRHLRNLDEPATPEEVTVNNKCRGGDGITANAVQEGEFSETHDPDTQVNITELPPYSFSNCKFSMPQQGVDEPKTRNEIVRGMVLMVRLIS
jgi:hypothetical protein